MLRPVHLAAGLCLLVGLSDAHAFPQTPAPAAPKAAPAPAAPAPTKMTPAPKTMLSTKEVMRLIVNPAAELFWKHSGEVVDEEGVKNRAPVDDDAMWQAMTEASAVLEESGNLLMMDGRARDERWMRYAQQLADAGASGIKSARAKDKDAAFASGSEMYDSCYACHGRYIPRPANSLYDAPLYKEK